MHERIQYFAEQAVLEGPQGQVDFREFLNYFAERFSQLIIEECAQIASTAEQDKVADLIRSLAEVQANE